MHVGSYSLADQYLYAFWWSVDCISGANIGVGFPQTSLQRAYAVLMALTHLLVIAVVISKCVALLPLPPPLPAVLLSLHPIPPAQRLTSSRSVEAVLRQWNQHADEYRLRVVKLNQMMQRRRLPRGLRGRIRKYYNHVWSRHGAFDSPEILRDLPVNLRQEVHVHTYGNVLAKVPVFSDCEEDFLNALTEKVNLRIYAPGDAIVRYGEAGDEMFFLNRVRQTLRKTGSCGHRAFALFPANCPYPGPVLSFMDSPISLTAGPWRARCVQPRFFS